MITFWIIQSVFAVLVIFVCVIASCIEAQNKKRVQSDAPRVVEPIPGSFDWAICARCGYEIRRYETRMMSHAHRLSLCEACSIDAPSCLRRGGIQRVSVVSIHAGPGDREGERRIVRISSPLGGGGLNTKNRTRRIPLTSFWNSALSIHPADSWIRGIKCR